MSLELSGIRQEMLGAEARHLSRINDLPEDMRASARNLVHYLALRRHDLRGLQDQLTSVGLSSLASAETKTLGHVEAVLDVVVRLSGATARIGASREDGRAHLKVHTDALFGTAPRGRDTRIMVTMPDEAADDEALVQGLVEAGMDCMRINCAHGTCDAWSGMLRNLAEATRATGQECRVLMDLAGPKLRTGTIAPGPAVVRWRPGRDVYGRVIAPARIWLTAREHPLPSPDPGATALCVRGSWLAHLVAGDRIRLQDARGARRELTVVDAGPGGLWGESTQTAYVVPGTPLVRETRPGDGERRTYVDDLPPIPQQIDLKAGDTLILTRDLSPGHPAVLDDNGLVVQPAEIGVTLAEVFEDVKPGEAVWLDDGKIGGVIRQVSRERLVVTITHANTVGLKLGADKGINLPDSTLRLPPLTPKDVEDLRFIAAHADIVAYSFVRTAEDVDLLQRELAVLGRPELPLVLKIETRRAFENLPSLLLAAMRSAASGVMIARGDLAVECGYERLAEIQEDILGMAEASHIPVIWATQVLERLAKEGIPTRAEITDAAMAERAECVMLNKGPYIQDAVRALDNILARMQTHQRKKSVMLSPLGVAEGFFTPPSPLSHPVPLGG